MCCMCCVANCIVDVATYIYASINQNMSFRHCSTQFEYSCAGPLYNHIEDSIWIKLLQLCVIKQPNYISAAAAAAANTLRA